MSDPISGAAARTWFPADEAALSTYRSSRFVAGLPGSDAVRSRFSVSLVICFFTGQPGVRFHGRNRRSGYLAWSFCHFLWVRCIELLARAPGGDRRFGSLIRGLAEEVSRRRRNTAIMPKAITPTTMTATTMTTIISVDMKTPDSLFVIASSDLSNPSQAGNRAEGKKRKRQTSSPGPITSRRITLNP